MEILDYCKSFTKNIEKILSGMVEEDKIKKSGIVEKEKVKCERDCRSRESVEGQNCRRR